MAKGVTDSKHYTQAANAIRDLTGTQQSYYPYELAQGIRQVFDAGKQEVLQRHFVTVVHGDGTGTLQTKIPFAPDCILLCGMDPLAQGQTGGVMLFFGDLQSFAYLAGTAVASRGAGNAPYTAAFRLLAVQSRISIEDDGTVTFSGLPSASGGTMAVFPKGAAYVICATKYTDKSLRQRIEEYIRSLPDEGGALLLAKSVVEEAFADGSFDTLADEKPNWEFTLGE